MAEDNEKKKKPRKRTPAAEKDGGGQAKEHKKPWQETYATKAEIKQMLADHVYLRYNTVKHREEFRLPAGDPFVMNTDLAQFVSPDWQPLNDRVRNTLKNAVDAVKESRKNDFLEVLESGFLPAFNPFLDYLDHLPPWDGQSHILALSTSVNVQGGVDMQLRFYECLRKWLVAMVASWLDEDEVNQTVLVLIGEQGCYKTAWFTHLLPSELRQYFRIKLNAGSMRPDDYIALSQFGLVCLEELAPMRPQQVETMKSMITAPAIDERKPYGRYPEHMAHVASFCGTGNNVQFLNDPNGNRRWLPFLVDSILDPRTHPFDYEHIYAEAYALYRKGFRHYFNDAEVEALKAHTQTFEVPDPAKEIIEKHFRAPAEGERGDFYTATDILTHIGHVPALDLTAQKIGTAMHKLNYKQCRSHGRYGYRLIAFSGSEIEANRRTLADDAKPLDEAEGVGGVGII